MSLEMMERWRDNQHDSGQATATATENDERDVDFVCPPPLPPSPTWLSSLPGRPDTQKTQATLITRGANPLTLDEGSRKSNKWKSPSVLGNPGSAEDDSGPAQKAASGTTSKAERKHSASVPAVHMPRQEREGAAVSPAHPGKTTEIIQVKAHRRIIEKVLGVRYTKISQKVRPVEDFKHARLDDHDRLDEAFYKFRRLMSQQRKELRLPGSRKPYGRVIIEEEGPPLKRTACILLRPFRDEMEVTAYHAILSKSTWREHYSPLTLLYEKQKSRLDYVSARPEARLVNAAPKDTLCGTLAMIGNEQRRRVVTIGGILQIGDKLWATTAAHSIPDEDEESTSSTVETLTEGMIHPEEYPEDVAEALVFAKTDKEAQSEPIVPPTYTGAGATAGGYFPRLQLLGEGEGEESGGDWSLFLIKDRAMALPNVAHAHNSDLGEFGLENPVYLVASAEKHPGPCDAEVLAGVTGSVAVKMTPGQMEVPLPSGSWVTAWECIVKSGQCLRRGDSGSWIVNTDTGTVYGQVVATMGDSVFMLPMKTLFHEIEERRESAGSQVTVFLPSPSILLTDLAQYHRHVLDDTETAYRYEQAAFRTAQLDISSSATRRGVPGRPLGAPDSAVPKLRSPDPARISFQGMHGRDTAKPSPSTPMPSAVWEEEDVAESSKSFSRSTDDILAHYMRMRFSQRAEFYHTLHADDQRRIDAYIRKVTLIRGAMAPGKHLHLQDKILPSVKNWREMIEDRNVPGWRRKHLGMSPAFGLDLSEESMRQSSTSQHLLEYDPLMDIMATKASYSGYDGWSGPHVDVELEAIPLKELLEDPAKWLQRGMLSDHVTRITHIHIPATNMKWAQKIIKLVHGDCVGQLLCPNSRRRTSTGTWRMRTTASIIRRGPETSHPVATVICVPFLDWERPQRYMRLARSLQEIQGDEKKGASTGFLSRSQLRRRRQPDRPFAREAYFLEPYTSMLASVESRGKRDQGRRLARTALGQVFLDAANLAVTMSTHRERALLQRYAHSNGDMSYRQPFVRKDLQTHGFSNDDIVYRASAHARMLMLGDLWLWVLDKNTILTCLAPRVGEDAGSDSTDLQREIHQVLSDQLHHGLECTVDNILTVILEVCLDTMFKGLSKSHTGIDVIGVAESEIASLSHGADPRKHVFSDRFSASSATTRTSRHTTQWTRRQKLVEDENLTRAILLGHCIAQLEEIVDLTRQQIAALSNIARVHDLLWEDKRASDNGVMHLSQNIIFVQLQFKLEGRMTEFEELLRRARKVRSSLNDVESKRIWAHDCGTATPENPSVVPVILATFLPLIFTTTLFSAIDVGRLFWIIFPIGFTLLCATMLVFITPLWRILRESAGIVVTFLITHTGLNRLWKANVRTATHRAPQRLRTRVEEPEGSRSTYVEKRSVLDPNLEKGKGRATGGDFIV